MRQRDFDRMWKKAPALTLGFFGIMSLVSGIVFMKLKIDSRNPVDIVLILVGSVMLLVSIIWGIARKAAKKSEEENQEMDETYYLNAKEQSPTYSLIGFDFNINTRVARLEIEQMQKYRTIERYVTRDYVKYPVYSDWKTRVKIIKKNLKLTNAELESLESHDDMIIRKFSKEIIDKIGRDDLIPFWYKRKSYGNEYQKKLDEFDSRKTAFINSTDKKIDSCKEKINTLNQNLARQNKTLKTISRRKIYKIENAKFKTVKNIFTIFIYSASVSKKRKEKLSIKLSEKYSEINFVQDSVSKLLSEIGGTKKEIESLEYQKTEKEKEIKNQIDEEYKSYMKKLRAIKPLSNEIKADKDFVMLKELCGMEYKKIIGCYVIHNREKDKCYVGQSKDVIKRIKQHFRGTIPNNIVFAEDYYSSSLSKKEDLFDIKIIPCETKDELDRTEKQLIQEYDSYKSGYNGTSGNT